MSRGPLPNSDAARRNEPTIPTSLLPSSGRVGPTPALPSWRSLGESGQAWWVWAWSTPQAAAWPSGTEDFVARRAALEDDLRVLDIDDALDLADLLQVDDSERLRALKFVMQRLHALVGGRLAVMKEMRELDNRLGLNAKAMADLRWSVATSEAATATPAVPRKATARRGSSLKVLTGGVAS